MSNSRLSAHFLFLILSFSIAFFASAQAKEPGAIYLNQAGFHPSSVKLAVVADGDAIGAHLIDSGGTRVFSAELPAAEYWPHSGENVRIFDFSSVEKTGIYRVQLDTGAESQPFAISQDAVYQVGLSALRSFYFIRSGTALTADLAGPWARAAGHPDTQVKVHESAAGPVRTAGTRISSPGGWYDAGDYNKYIVNSAITVYFLLMPYEICPTCYPDASSNIPESGNGQPDLLDEVRFNLDWMLTMQDPADGGVYHKLTSKNFSSFVMPENDQAERYVVQKSTAAALDFAAVTAYASRQFRATDAPYAQQLLLAAENAWAWAVQNPAIAYQQPADIRTGTYANPKDTLTDEWSWARVELFLTTGGREYLADWDPAQQGGGPPDWSHVGSLAWLSLVNASNAPTDLSDIARSHIMLTAEHLLAASQIGYRVSIGAYDGSERDRMYLRDWVWGSNGVAAVQAVMLEQAWRLSGNPDYLHAAVADLDYLLGRNPNGISYVTGLGEYHTMNLHSRPSQADAVVEPVPGLLAGGPHNDHQDRKDCEFNYVGSAPAKSYYDHYCSYATNEHAINWNGALVAAALLIHYSLSATPP